MTRFLAMVMTTSLIASTDAQTNVGTERKPSSTDADIVVVGSREEQAIEHRHAAEYVRAVSQLPTSGQYARWHDPICPRVTGLDASATNLVETRIKRVAIDAGVRTGAAGCRPNLVVIFTLDGDATLKTLEQRRFAYPRSVTPAERQTIRVAKQPVRWWVDTDIRDADGEPLASSPNPGLGAVNLPTDERTRFTNSYSSSLIETKIRAVIPAAVVIVDVIASSGKKLVSVSDYVAFMVLGRARSVVTIPMPTIARLFDPTCATCTVLTAVDRGYLNGLYRLPANRPAHEIRRALASRIAAGRTVPLPPSTP